MPKTLEQSVRLPAPPDELFDAYLDPERHAAITGQPVTVSPEPGAPFSAFGGLLTGKILAVRPGRMIAQTWRSVKWGQDDLDSILVLTFSPDSGGGRIDLVHVNVADQDYEGVRAGWEKYYWAPWRDHLKERAGS